jgi:hypothetical protein
MLADVLEVAVELAAGGVAAGLVLLPSVADCENAVVDMRAAAKSPPISDARIEVSSGWEIHADNFRQARSVPEKPD